MAYLKSDKNTKKLGKFIAVSDKSMSESFSWTVSEHIALLLFLGRMQALKKKKRA